MLSRLVVGLWGGPKAGKSHCALGFPIPIVVFDFNYGLEGVIEKFEKEPWNRRVYHVESKLTIGEALAKGDIVVYHYPRRLVHTMEERYAQSSAVYARFSREYQEAVDRIPEGGTLFIDTATEVDDLVQIVKLEEVRVHKYHGKTQAEDFQPAAFDYGARNEEIGNVYRAPLQRRGINAVFAHKSKQKYEGKEAIPDAIEMAGWKGAPHEVQAMVQSIRHGAGVNVAFKGRLSYSRMWPQLEGIALDELSHDFLYAVIDGAG